MYVYMLAQSKFLKLYNHQRKHEAKLYDEMHSFAQFGYIIYIYYCCTISFDYTSIIVGVHRTAMCLHQNYCIYIF